MWLQHVVLRIVIATGMAVGWMSASAANETVQRRNVLYLTAEGVDHKYFGAAYLAFKDELDKVLPQQTVVYAENLDLARFITPDYHAALADWLRTKYAGVRIDAIVTTGTPALKFLVDTRLWPGVPTYFSHTNEGVVRTLALPPNITGQTFIVSFDRTLALIRAVLPRTRRIVIIGNVTADDVYRPFMARELAGHESAFSFVDLRGKPVEDVLKAVAALGDDTVVYRTGFSRTADGQVFDSFAVFQMIAARASRPVFAEYSPLIGLGAVGGVAIDPGPQGRNAARQVARLLAGVEPARIPVTRMEFAPAFDWRQLRRWHIAEDALPPHSQVWFYAPTIAETYRWQIVSVLTAMAILVFLVVALLAERRRRAVAVAESRKRLAELAHLNRHATATVYSGAVAHELNQPLAAILANAQAARLILGQMPPALDDVREIIDDIERDDRRASELIRSMRGLLRKGEVRHEVLDISSLVNHGVLFVRPEAAVRHVAIRIRLPEQPVHVLGDRIQLQQVLINLVINSMDAMAELPVSARIVEITAATDGDAAVAVTVSDAGTGFPGDVTRVFESFTTTKAHGTGLGLAITAALVREHGGTIVAANRAGRGARVTFSLPRVAADATPAMDACARPASITGA
jgi:signal transduction histidine kinase